MNTPLIRFAAALSLLAVIAPIASAAMPVQPPRWAVGTFRGTNRKYRLDVELRIDENGIVRRWTWKPGERRSDTDPTEGGWENGEIVFVGDRFRVERTGSGFVTTKESDKNDVTEFRRGSRLAPAPDRSPLPDRAPRVPDRTPLPSDSRVPGWAVGTFRGPNSKYKLDVELRINRSGAVERSIWKDRDNRPDTTTGRWEDGEVVFGRDHFTVSQSRDGIRTEKRGDRSDVTILRRR